jgi:hypothetical protein
MANGRQTGHQIRAGTYTSSGMGTAYAITSMPLQTDQVVDGQVQVPWVAPMKIAAPEYSRIYNTVDGSQRPDGYLNVEWILGYMTFGMFTYWLNTFFPSSVYSSPVTIKTFDSTDSPIYIQCIAYRPRIPDDVEWAIGGYQNVKMRFVFGVPTT